MPSLWQTFAIALAKNCHRFGKELPPLWQSFANEQAKPCR
ncbi:hypothetical protein HMPREF9446_02755 [Bacteroides fluxus YIT 12057]|uniref:Uncharacterized protein n=1 Tax=Bacteroides fluxus YIT 12057 TaxID=763034 RepID=F3PVH7_9BACE|nr:hypothetical protein HMPREF9446_02755 [Bacteroides fluxus YIT 12057]